MSTGWGPETKDSAQTQCTAALIVYALWTKRLGWVTQSIWHGYSTSCRPRQSSGLHDHNCIDGPKTRDCVLKCVDSVFEMWLGEWILNPTVGQLFCYWQWPKHIMTISDMIYDFTWLWYNMIFNMYVVWLVLIMIDFFFFFTLSSIFSHVLCLEIDVFTACMLDPREKCSVVYSIYFEEKCYSNHLL